MTTPNLHELANTPGAGRAKAALREAGCWRLTEDDKASLPRWEVEVVLTLEETEHVPVAAYSEAEARRLVQKFDGWNSTGKVVDVCIVSVSKDLHPIGDPAIVEGDE